MGVKYIDETQEFIAFCSDVYKMNLIKFEKDLNEKCYLMNNITNEDNSEIIYSHNLLYIQSEKKYYLIKTINNSISQTLLF